ncbi:hypothetical protein ACKI1O_13380 [Streptomyces scabiei]
MTGGGALTFATDGIDGARDRAKAVAGGGARPAGAGPRTPSPPPVAPLREANTPPPPLDAGT